MVKKIFSIKGMNCNSCAMLIEKELKDKVNNISASFSKEQAKIDFDEIKISENEIKEIINKLGYEAEVEKTEVEVAETESTKDSESENLPIPIASSANSKSKDNRYVAESKKEDSIAETEKDITGIQKPVKRDKPYKSKDIVISKLASSKESLIKPNITPKKNLSDKIGWIFVVVSSIILVLAIFHFFQGHIKVPEFSELKIPEGGERAGLLLLFAAGILTGFHCISMCGGFVVSYTAKNAINGHKSFKQHLVYGSSKLISYTIIGGIFGLIGGIFAFSIGLRGAVAIFAGVFMVFYALSMFGLKFFRKFQLNPKFLTKFTMNASANAKGPYKGPMITGLLNGLFIACGPLQAMYLYAAGTGSFINGATSLAVFGLGTLPIMIGFGSLATAISHKTTQKILKISAIIVLILGLIMLNRGLTMIGSSYNYESIKTKLIGSNSVSGGTNSVITNGVQEINMNVDASGYSPNSFVLKKGVPVKWNVNVKQLTGCNSELISRQYNINKNLKQGLNVIEFTPDKEGTIPFSCGMGMLKGSFIVTESGTASQQQINSAAPKSTTGCSMGADGGGCGGGCGGGSSGGGCGCGGG